MKALSSILLFFTKHLLVIHQGETLVAKVKSTFIIAFSTGPFVYMWESLSNWTMQNDYYVSFTLGAIAIDHILGSAIHAFKPSWSWKKNVTGLLTKVGLVVAMGFLFEGINEIISEDTIVKSYITIVLRLAVFLYPAGSAFMNSAYLTKGKFPPLGLINKVTKFNMNLDLKEFKVGEEEINETPVEYEQIKPKNQEK